MQTMRQTALLTLAIALALTGIGSAGGQTSGQPSQPTGTSQGAGRGPIQTKTPAEYQAYQAAIANAQNAQAMEKAADDFAAKFPDSAVRVLLYRSAMNAYQNAGNPQKLMDVGLKVLDLDKDDPEALISVAEVLQEQTSPTDLDKDKRAKRAIDYAQHALETIDTDLAVPSGTPNERVEAYKKTLRSSAFAIVGTLQYKQEQYADAESNLRKAIDAGGPVQDVCSGDVRRRAAICECSRQRRWCGLVVHVVLDGPSSFRVPERLAACAVS